MHCIFAPESSAKIKLIYLNVRAWQICLSFCWSRLYPICFMIFSVQSCSSCLISSYQNINMLGWPLLRHPDWSMAKYPPAATSLECQQPWSWRYSLTEQHVARLIQQVCEHIKGWVEVCISEEPVVVVVRHAGISHISADKNYFRNIQQIWWQ